MLGALMITTGCSSETDGPPERAACIVDGDGVEICVREQGASLDAAGTVPVIALAGQPYWNSAYLQEPISRLLDNAGTEGFSVRIASFDYRGIGETAPPADDNAYALENYANDVEAVRKKLGADQVHLIAHGFGALVAYEYLRLYPGNAAGLFLINPHTPSVDPNREAIAEISLRIGELQSDGLAPSPLPPDDGDSCRPEQAATIRLYFHSWDIKDYVVPQDILDIDCSRSLKLRHEAFLQNSIYDFGAATNAFTGPLLTISGKSDVRNASQHHDDIVSKFANARDIDISYEGIDGEVTEQCGPAPVCNITPPAAGFFPWYEAKEDLMDPNAAQGVSFTRASYEYFRVVSKL